MNKVRCLWILAVLLCSGTVAWAGVTGPSLPLPSWEAGAQVKLGWIFADPTNPQDSDLQSEWDKYVGADLPSWVYVPVGPRWEILIPNVAVDNPRKHFWLSYIYDFDPLYGGLRSTTDIFWMPDAGFENFSHNETWYTAAGTVTNDHMQADCARVTINVDLLPNPYWEEVVIGVNSRNNAYNMKEVYVMTQCIPAPGAMLLAGIGLGVTGWLRRQRVV